MARNVLLTLLVCAVAANAQPYLLDPFFESPDVDPGLANAVPVPVIHGEAVDPPTTNVWMQSYGGPAKIYEKHESEVAMGDAPQGDQMLLCSGWQQGGNHGSRANYITDYILQEGDVIRLTYWCYIATDETGDANIMARNWQSEGYWDNVSADKTLLWQWQFVDGTQAPCPAGNAGENLYLQTNSWANYGHGVCFDDIHLYINGENVTIPEPMTLSLLALGGLAAIRRRR
jgi:hypothetical protein